MEKYTKEIPIYFGRLQVIIAEDLKEAWSIYGRKLENEMGSFDAVTDTFIRNSILHVQIFVKPNATLKIIAHESAHAVNMIFDHVGVELSTTNDEPFCYMLGWVVEQVEDCLGKYKHGKAIKGQTKHFEE